MTALHTRWIACEQCDLLHHRPELPEGSHATCQRCGAHLDKAAPASLDLPMALVLTAQVLLIVAHLYPVMAFQIQGQTESATLWQAAMVLYRHNGWVLGMLVLATTLVFPAMQLLALGLVLVPLRNGTVPPGFSHLLRTLQTVRPWVMIEVFMMGVLVALVKLAGLATIVTGVGLWAFASVMVLLAAISAKLELQTLWEMADRLQQAQRRLSR